jgi:stage II sporulation protein D
MHRRLAVLAVVLGLVATAAPSAAGTARDPASVTITTWGNGHGKGLSQYGALNRAKDGQTYRQIVRFYYPHTAWRAASGTVRVLLTDDTGDDVVVDARNGLEAHSLGTGRTWTLPVKREGRTISRWRITASGAKSVLSYRTDSWHAWRRAAGDAEFTAGNRPMTLRTPEGAATYRGTLRSSSVGPGRDTVNAVRLDVYLRGVVPQEMPALWPSAAVRAQAVAARTYAVYERDHAPAGRAYDLCDTSTCQVYGGADAEHPASDAAVAATAGEIVTYGGDAAFAQFSASNGGYSVAGGQPYLVATRDAYDDGAPGDPYARTYAGDAITRHWPGLGDLLSVKVTHRDRHGTPDVPEGRATMVQVTGTDGSVEVSGSTFRTYLGLRSTLLRVSGP